eukprot:TRINITY_DN8193_c1_g3_i1.p1 TRINITY_DN8193_c1_g3~~TRINITY_DN8193_c1_g3_i1.p1  ORF type:complete len:517 (+),score=146.92 TRINITY_DN8193_c1_g3_i1:50-1600(+)
MNNNNNDDTIDPVLNMYNGDFKINVQPVFQQILETLLTYLEQNVDSDVKVLEYKDVEELKGLSNTTELPVEGKGLTGIINDVDNILKYSVRTGHKMFYNQLFAGNDLASLIGEFVTACINTPSYTYEIGPMTTLIEIQLINKMCEMVGFENGEGVFAPGGSLSNLMAVLLCRFNKFPESKENGNLSIGKDLVIFSSIQSHYSLKRAAAIMGIGTKNVIPIPANKEGQMDTKALREAIETVLQDDSKVPIGVFGTAGTTVLAAFDPFVEIAEICKEYDLWFHIDGCQGSSVLFSKEHAHLMKGSHLADSVCWNPHKMLGINLQCSAILVKKKGFLLKCNSSCADYLFHSVADVNYDLGDNTIQCGRKLDHLKFWLSWQAHGTKGFEYRINKAFENARYFTELIKTNDRFQLVVEPASHSVCFWCLPNSLKNTTLSFDGDNVEEINKTKDLITNFAHAIRINLRQRGNTLLNYQPLVDQNYPYFFRLTVHNPLVKHSDLDDVIVEFETIMDQLEAENQ